MTVNPNNNNNNNHHQQQGHRQRQPPQLYHGIRNLIRWGGDFTIRIFRRSCFGLSYLRCLSHDFNLSPCHSLETNTLNNSLYEKPWKTCATRNSELLSMAPQRRNRTSNWPRWPKGLGPDVHLGDLVIRWSEVYLHILHIFVYAYIRFYNITKEKGTWEKHLGIDDVFDDVFSVS